LAGSIAGAVPLFSDGGSAPPQVLSVRKFSTKSCRGMFFNMFLRFFDENICFPHKVCLFLAMQKRETDQ